MQPDKIMKEQRDESMEREIFKVDVQKKVTSMAIKNPITIAYEKLKGRLNNKFWLVPIEGDRVVVRVHAEDKKEAAKLLLGFDDKILIKVVTEKEEVPSDQITMEVPLTSPPPAPVAPTYPNNQYPQRQPYSQNKQFVKPVPEEATPEAAPAEGTSLEELMNQLKGATPEVSAGAEKGAVAVEREVKPAIDELIAATVANKKTIDATPELLRLPGLYFNEPIAKNMASGKQVAFIKPKRMNELLEEKYLLAGQKVYGVLTVRDIINDFDFDQTFKYHQMTNASRQKNWGDSPLYLYVYDLELFKTPVDYKTEPGARNIITINNPQI